MRRIDMNRLVIAGLLGTTVACSQVNAPSSSVDAPAAQGSSDAAQVFGVTWLQVAKGVEFGTRTQFDLVVYNNELWLFGGQSGASYFSDVWYSQDGVRWTGATASAPFGAVHGQACIAPFNGAMWLVNGGGVWSSADGITWNNHGWAWGAPAASAQCVAWNGKLWYFGTAGGGVHSSSDGTVWAPANVPADLKAGVGGVAVFNGALYATTANGIYSTTDGATWLPLNATFFEAPNLVGCETKLWSLSYGNVWSSGDGVNWNKTTSHGPATEVLVAWQPKELNSPELWTVDNDANVWVSRGPE
jgi:hypothetical protein